MEGIIPGDELVLYELSELVVPEDELEPDGELDELELDEPAGGWTGAAPELEDGELDELELDGEDELELFDGG